MINKQKGACGANLSNLTNDLSELEYGHRGPLVDFDQNKSQSKDRREAPLPSLDREAGQ
jgi:hypothetical protein